MDKFISFYQILDYMNIKNNELTNKTTKQIIQKSELNLKNFIMLKSNIRKLTELI